FFKDEERAPPGNVPTFCNPVLAKSEQATAIRRKQIEINARSVTDESRQRLPSDSIPQPGGAILAAGEELLAVSRNSQPPDDCAVPFARHAPLPCLELQQMQCPALMFPNQRLAFGREDDWGVLGLRTRQREYLSCCQLPQLSQPISRDRCY